MRNLSHLLQLLALVQDAKSSAQDAYDRFYRWDTSEALDAIAAREAYLVSFISRAFLLASETTTQNENEQSNEGNKDRIQGD